MKKVLLFLSAAFLLAFPLSTFAQDEYSLSLFEEFTGEAAGDYAGVSVASAGDVNGDGYEDFIVGARQDDDAGADAGAAYLIYGSDTVLTGASLSTAVKFTGEAAGDKAGSSVASAGDVNGDGYDDFLVAAYGDDDAGADAGAAYLIYGSDTVLTGASLSTAVKFTGEAAGDQVGILHGSLALAGDVNNDGYDDFLVGVRYNGASNDGAAYLMYGQAAQLSNASLSTAVKFTGEAVADNAGSFVASAGDVNGDGYDDILTSAYFNDDGGTRAGAAYLIYGQADKLVNASLSTAIEFTGEADQDMAGVSVASAGDVNNDGYDDILISGHNNDAGGAEAGAAYLIYGQADNLTGASLSAAIKFTGEAAGDQAGISVASAGDVNNDGYDDFIVGARRNDDAGADAGAVYFIYGQADNLTSAFLSTAIKFTGEAAGDSAGFPVALAGDVNNDGFDDILIGAYLNDNTGVDAGTAYLGYLYIDNDRDGTPGTDGIFDGTDCNDNDDTVASDQTYYEDADGDGLGNPLVTIAICSSTPPTGYVTNANDTDDTIKDILSVTARKRGNIKVTYINNDTTIIDVFGYKGTDKVTLSQYQDNYYLVLQPKAKKLAFVDVNALSVLSKKFLAKKNFKYNSLKTYTLRKKKWAVVTGKNKKGKVKLSVVRVKVNKETLGKRVYASLVNGKIRPAKTKNNKNTILLRGGKGAVISKYLMTKKLNLKKKK